jgi:predicted Zn-dependent peptidase
MAHQALMPEHPYSHPVSGELESVFNLSREQLQRFHRLWFVSGRISVIIVGDVSEEQALALCKQNFEQLPRAFGGKEGLSEGVNSPPTNQERYHSGALAFVGLAVKAPGISLPREVCALDVLLSLIGESKSSRLRQSLLSKPQAAFSTGGEYLTSREPSPFLLWASCLPDQREAVKSKMETVLDELVAGKVTPAEIAAAKRSLLTSFWLSNETFDDRADVLGFYEDLQNLQFGREYVQQVRAVSLADIQAAAKRYFAKPDRAWIELIPNSKTEKISL